MEYIAIAAIAVFAITLFLMIKHPRDLRLGYAAGFGAVASLLLGTVSYYSHQQDQLRGFEKNRRSSKRT